MSTGTRLRADERVVTVEEYRRRGTGLPLQYTVDFLIDVDDQYILACADTDHVEPRMYCQIPDSVRRPE